MFFQGRVHIENGRIIGREARSGFVEILQGGRRLSFSENKFLMPKFFDAHGHLLELGTKLKGLNLYDCFSKEECLEKIKSLNFIIRGDWITGIGWNQEKWRNKEYPSKEDLDSIFPNTPVYLLRADAHCAWVNSKAISLIETQLNNTSFDEGSIIMKNNQMLGIFIDEAMMLFKGIIPNFLPEQLESLILAAQEDLLSCGVYSVCEMDTSQELIGALLSLDNKKLLNIKVFCYLKGQNEQWLNYHYKDSQNVKFNGIKLFADGALGSRGALLFDEYKDESGNYGLELLTQEEIYQRAVKAIDNGLSVAIHCIGDRANYNTLKALSRIAPKDRNGLHFRIEHCQLLREQDLQLFADNDIIASVQPTHCISDAPAMIEARIKKNNHKNCYRWKSLLNIGIKIIGGSDFPIESHNPIYGINAFTKRIPSNQTAAWYPEEIISEVEAVKCFSQEPAELFDSKFNSEIIENYYISD